MATQNNASKYITKSRVIKAKKHSTETLTNATELFYSLIDPDKPYSASVYTDLSLQELAHMAGLARITQPSTMAILPKALDKRIQAIRRGNYIIPDRTL